MVQVIHPSQTHYKKPSFGQQVLGGINRGLPAVQDYLQQQQENKAIKERFGANVEGIYDPNIRHTIVGEELSRTAKRRKGEESLYGKEPKTGGISKSGGISSTPQGREPRRPKSVKSFQELQQEAAMNTQKKLDQGLEADFDTELANLVTLNTAQKVENQEIEQEQSNLSKTYNEKLANVVGGAPDEVKVLADARAEKAFDSGMTYPEVVKDAVQFSKELGNNISKVKNGIKAISEPFDKAKNALRNNVQPLKDMGLNDTARNLLDQAGYIPEQVEEVMTTLPEGVQKELATMPKFKVHYKNPKSGEEIGLLHGKLNDEEKQRFKDAIQNIFTKDPSTNLILLRQAFKDKNINWEEYRETIVDMIADGKLKLNDQQWENKKYIDEPPLEGLTKLWKKFKGYF